MSQTPPPAFASPPGAAPSPSASATKPPAGGLAIAVLVVGIAAFVVGWVPVLGLVLGLVGLILGILALRRSSGRVLAIIGTVLSGLATIAGIVSLIVLIVALPRAIERVKDSAGSTVSAATQAVATPCFSYDGPRRWVNNISAESAAACNGKLELWGYIENDGTVKNTGVDNILGSVQVEPVSTTSSDAWNPSGTVDGMVDYLSKDYIPKLGTLISLTDKVTVDGTEANLTRVTSAQASTKTKALLVLKAPQPYTVDGKTAQFFIVSFVTPEDNGDALIAKTINSWSWK